MASQGHKAIGMRVVDVREELARLVSYNTVNNPAADQRPGPECPTHIKEIWEQFGFDTRVLEYNGVYTVVGIMGQGTPITLFLAHYDVVPTGEGWKTDPFQLSVDGDRAYGRGTVDDKGNVVALMLLAERLGLSEFTGTVVLAATGDEEIGGRNGAGYLRDYLHEIDLAPRYAVIADSAHERVVFRRRNVLPTTLTMRRKIDTIVGRSETVRFTTESLFTDTRHAAYLQPGVDRQAMLAASKYLALHPEFVVADIRGPFLKSNVIPDWVELDIIQPDVSGKRLEYDVTLTGLMRLLLPITRISVQARPSDIGTTIAPTLLTLKDDVWTLYCDVRAMINDGNTIKRAIESILAGRLDYTTLTVSNGAGYVESDLNSRLMQAIRKALHLRGMPCHFVESPGASDSRYFAGPGCEVFDFGPEGDNLHGPNEWVSLSSIERTAEIYYTLLQLLGERDSQVV